jgi:hypothetical protein
MPIGTQITEASTIRIATRASISNPQPAAVRTSLQESTRTLSAEAPR